MGRTDYYADPAAPKATTIKPAVSAFVRDRAGRLLMIRRTDNDLYAIPGGAQEPGETLSEAVVREVQEETGITVEVVGVVGLYSNPAHVVALTTARSVRSSRSAFGLSRSTASHEAAAKRKKSSGSAQASRTA